METKPSAIEKRAYWAIAAMVFGYVFIRSFTVPLANDEAATFFTFVHTSDFIPFVSDYWSANNHFVNTLLTWICYQLFGEQEWALRLPNVLAFALFLYFVFKIGTRLNKAWLRWLFWVPLFSAHYIVEFFAYSRGYGLSLAFLMGYIHLLIQAQEDQNNRYTKLYLAVLLLFLGVMSNLNLLISYLIGLALVQLPQLQNFKWKKWLSFNLIAAAPLAIPITISLILKSKEELYIGQPSLVKTWHTLMVRFTGIADDLSLTFLIILLSLLLTLGLWLAVRSLLKKWALSPLLIFVVLLSLNLLAAQLMSSWLGVLFPTERTAMHWVPLLIGMGTFSISLLKGLLQKLSGIALALIWLSIPIFGFKSVNPYASSDPHWALEQIPDSFYFAVQKDSDPEGFPRSVSSSTSLNTFTWAFKNLKYKGGLDACIDFKFWNPEYVADYLILNLKEFKDFTPQYDTLIYDPYSAMTLLKRKALLSKSLLASTDTSSYGQRSEEWFILGDWQSIDSLTNKAIRLDYTLDIRSPKDPLPSLVTLELKDSLNNVTHYNQYRLDYFKTDFGHQEVIKASLMLDSVPSGTASLRTLLWNIKSKPFTLNSCRVDFYQLVEN